MLAGSTHCWRRGRPKPCRAAVHAQHGLAAGGFVGTVRAPARCGLSREGVSVGVAVGAGRRSRRLQ